MAKVSDRQALQAYVDAGFSMSEAARQLGCSADRIKSALKRCPLSSFLDKIDAEYQARKHLALAELANLEIVR